MTIFRKPLFIALLLVLTFLGGCSRNTRPAKVPNPPAPTFPPINPMTQYCMSCKTGGGPYEEVQYLQEDDGLIRIGFPTPGILEQATLWIPFEFKSSAGFVVQHNGVFDTLAVIDSAYLESAERWKAQEPEYEFIAGAVPIFTRIVYFPMVLEARLCEKGVRFAVAENGGMRGYTIIVNGKTERWELPLIFSEAFWRLYLVIAGKKSPAAWTGEGCLQ